MGEKIHTRMMIQSGGDDDVSSDIEDLDADNTALAAVISLARRKISLARQRVLRTATANKQTARFRQAC